eukprot:snap_masked-scaffold_44-processed-gene-1.52-mRNA-1 protein AED:1.00 eAED:1.00 QI:0/0/0/0/1/1/3/0/124
MGLELFMGLKTLPCSVQTGVIPVHERISFFTISKFHFSFFVLTAGLLQEKYILENRKEQYEILYLNGTNCYKVVLIRKKRFLALWETYQIPNRILMVFGLFALEHTCDIRSKNYLKIHNFRYYK